MRNKLILVFLFIPFMAFSQNGTTFQIEELKKPDSLLQLTSVQNIYQNLIQWDANLNKYEIEKGKIEIPYNIIARNKENDSLVSFGYHPFFAGMYEAYSSHRPFVLSPDMIWLLICQGFAHHVTNNAEELRHFFVNFEGKTSLIVRNDNITLDNPDSPWELVFPEITKKIGEYTGTELIDVLTCNFSTSTPVTKVASEITIMEAMKAYFEYIVFSAGCGIPEITLEGNTADWEKLLKKAKYLRKYKLDWWIDEIEPILEKFVDASKGDISKGFWRKMFKYHSIKKYGAPNVIDGWIVKFFPYDKDGKKMNLDEIIREDKLPDEIVKADLKFIEINNDGKEENTKLELWAGFIGLKQNPETYALRPQIGWMIRKKDLVNKTIVEKFKFENSDESSNGISIRVKEVPNELLELKQISYLSIEFLDNINIPYEMGKIKINTFRMSGKISDSEIERICKLFPKTKLIINDKIYNENK